MKPRRMTVEWPQIGEEVGLAPEASVEAEEAVEAAVVGEADSSSAGEPELVLVEVEEEVVVVGVVLAVGEGDSVQCLSLHVRNECIVTKEVL